MLMANGAFTPLKQDMNHDGFLDQPIPKQYTIKSLNYHMKSGRAKYMFKVLNETELPDKPLFIIP